MPEPRNCRPGHFWKFCRVRTARHRSLRRFSDPPPAVPPGGPAPLPARSSFSLSPLSFMPFSLPFISSSFSPFFRCLPLPSSFFLLFSFSHPLPEPPEPDGAPAGNGLRDFRDRRAFHGAGKGEAQPVVRGTCGTVTAGIPAGRFDPVETHDRLGCRSMITGPVGGEGKEK